jgi:acetyl-CoA synthetase
MTENREPQVTEQIVSESSIAVHWREEEYYLPPASFVEQANAADPAIFDKFTEDRFPECFTEYADLLSWDARWHTTLDTSNPPFWKWFVGGRLNASYNCVDRHAEANPDKDALIWVPEPESDETRRISYAELYRRVNEFAAVLRDFAGLKTGDRVTLHMPMVPELPVTMLACARLGIIHSQVFGGFSGNACGTRIADSGSRVLITMDGYYRSGDLTDHKVKADEAVAEALKQGQEVDKVLVWRRHPGQYASQTPMVEGRDFFVDEELGNHQGQVVEPVSMPAEAPLFLMYTSGTTGRPKGCQHSTGGYMAYVAGTSTRTTCTGAWPTSAGSPGTPTSCTGRSRSAPPASSTRARRTTRMPGAPGGSRTNSASTSSTPRRPRSGCCARSAPRSRRSTRTASST